MYLMFVLSVLIHNHETVNGQSWITPTNRMAYGINGEPLSLEWKVDNAGKTIALSQFQLLDPDNADLVTSTIVFLDADQKITTSGDVTSTEFGKVTINKLDSGIHKKIKVTVEFVGADQIVDYLTIQYVDAIPVITNPKIESSYAFKEGDPATKNVTMEVTTRGNPTPTVLWTIDGKDVSTLPGFVIKNNEAQDGNDFVVTSILHIANLTGDHNGELKVVSKYGPAEESSPQAEMTSQIDIKYPPRNIAFTHNTTNNLIINEGYIWLKCTAEGNPTPTFMIKDGAELIYFGASSDRVIFLNKFHHTRKLHYQCTANNSLGLQHSPTIDIQIVNGTLTGKRYGEEDSSMWVYYGVACGVAFIVFIGVFVTLCLIRRRMRTLNLRDDINRVRKRDNQQQQQQQQQQTNGHNHVYDLNERGRRGTAHGYESSRARQMPQINQNPFMNSEGMRNGGFQNELYDEVSR